MRHGLTFGANGQVLEEEEDPRLAVLVEEAARVRSQEADERAGICMARKRGYRRRRGWGRLGV